MKTVRALPLIALIWTAACSSKAPEQAGVTEVTIEKPVIKNLDEVSTDLKKLKHSLVRIRVDNRVSESIGTGFFFRTRDLLVTTYHLFEDRHKCMTDSQCEVALGFAKDSKGVDERQVAVEVILKDPKKDLLFLKIKDNSQFADIVPIKDRAKNKKGKLVAAGFYQSNPALTFSHGKNLESKNEMNLTSIVVSSGFSGSPIVNNEGELVGMVSSYKPIVGSEVGLAQFMDIDDLSAF